MPGKKVWIQINKRAIGKNIAAMRNIIRPSTKLFAVVKSNAYGHGLTLFSGIAEESGVDGFCVDSLVEGLKLRGAGIRKPILVLGPTLPNGSLAEAATNDITVTISNTESLNQMKKSKIKPSFHVKVDTGMHRQGFFPEELNAVSQFIKKNKLPLTGVYTHFASAKDINYPTFTDSQFKKFTDAHRILETHGFKKLLRHAAATGGTMLSKKYHLDAVRIGIGLYGLSPSRELEFQRTDISLEPVLSWHSLVSEVKDIPAGGYIGYDLAERVTRKTKVAIVPIGYWHGFDRGLSHVGEVLIAGKRARVLGRVSMDILTVDATGIPVHQGSIATIIGRQGRETVSANEMGQKIGTSHYEIVTRINPLIERVIT
ncbi:MAG: alanine racemase [Patescibacteria group bacterium]